MIGTRHLPARSSGRLAFALPLVLALLAFALSPGLAQADSSGVIYGEAPPTVPGKKKTVGEDETRAHGSNTDSGGSTAPGGSGGSGGGSGSQAGSSGGTNPSTGGSDSAGQGADGKRGTAAGETGSVQSSQPVTTPAAADEDRSSSSPLVPILIAIAILAAISIGAVLIKQRRQRDGSDGSVAPKVG